MAKGKLPGGTYSQKGKNSSKGATVHRGSDKAGGKRGLPGGTYSSKGGASTKGASVHRGK